MTSKLLDDCFVHDKKRLSHDEALAILKSRITTVVGRDTVALAGAAGRILAEPAVAPLPVPAHTNAAVDGYAFAAADYDQVSVLLLFSRKLVDILGRDIYCPELE